MQEQKATRRLTSDEVASQLNCSVRKAQDLMATGEIVAFRVGKEWRCEETDLDSYVERQKRKSSKRHPQ